MPQPAGLDGSRLKALRTLKGFGSQQTFAAAIGVPQSHISDLEHGKLRSPTAFLRVADRLDCTTDFLFRRGPFRNADSPKKLRGAASKMALDVFAEALRSRRTIKIRQRWLDRCHQVIGHRAAPVTAQQWEDLAEQIELVVGSGKSGPKLRVVRKVS